jgi:hypothetical protein
MTAWAVGSTASENSSLGDFIFAEHAFDLRVEFFGAHYRGSLHTLNIRDSRIVVAPLFRGERRPPRLALPTPPAAAALSCDAAVAQSQIDAIRAQLAKTD